MNAPNPVTVTPENNPGTPEDTVVPARFNRKKLAKVAGTATAVVAALALFGSAMKKSGKKEFIEDVRTANGDVDDEITAS